MTYSRAAFDRRAARGITSARRDLQFVHDDGVIDLGWGHPDPAHLPVAAVRAAAHALLDHDAEVALSYGDAQGPGALRDAIATRATDVWSERVGADDVLITAGASGALELVLSRFSQRGDVVFVEQPTYFLALRVFADHGLRIVPLPSDEHGLLPDAVEHVAATPAAQAPRRFLYCVPTFSNPRGATLPDERREALVEAARRCRITVLEDDVYRDTASGGVAATSLWRLDPSVIRFGSFSKILGPGLRVGFATAPPARIAVLRDSGVLDSGGGVPHFTAMVVAEMMRSGEYHECAAEVSARLARHRAAMIDVLDHDLFDIVTPGGGYFLWLRARHAQLGEAFHERLLRRGVRVSDGATFFPAAPTESAIRLSASFFDLDTLVSACEAVNTAAAGN